MRTAAMPMLALAGLLGLGAGCRTKLRCYAHEQCGPNMVCTPDERCVPNLCGDGIQVGEEVCDDGNAVGGDGCAADCLSDESCGNGLVDEDAGEVCDDGNTVGGDGCGADCRSFGTCGDGTVDTAAGETCDDGNTAPNDGCGPTCQVERCGDGVQNGAEACDGTDLRGRTCADEGFVGGSLACDGTCALDRAGCHDCGNGVLDAGEACDGTELGGLACPDLGAGYTGGLLACSAGCDLDTSGCATCGNGVLEPTEACDDGNAEEWDGCTGCAITELRVNTTTTNYQSQPAIAMSADGRFVVVWSSDHIPGNSYDIFGQCFDAAGLPTGLEFQVNSYAPGVQQRPRVAMADDGRFMVVWRSEGQDGDGGGVYGQWFDAQCAAAGAEIQVNLYSTGDQAYADVAVAPDGHGAVVWSSEGQDGDSGTIIRRDFDSSGNFGGAEWVVNTQLTGMQSGPSIAMGAAGQSVVVWTSYSQDSYLDAGGIYGQGFDENALPYLTEFQVNTTTAGGQFVPRVAMSDAGGFLVTWTGEEPDIFPTDVFGQWYLTTGSESGSELRLNHQTQGSQTEVGIAMAGNGRTVTVWSSCCEGPPTDGVWGSLHVPFSNTPSNEFRVASYSLDLVVRPAVAMADDGRFVVVWESYGQDGDFSGIYAQKFTAAGVPVGAGPW